jgi:glycine/D-amino acid oxidase-like deaminating enzyme/nitrite reductase/ring-hydroxylating ferredoxin subunit
MWGRNPEYSFPTLSESLHVDVAVVGGGIAGVSTAYALARAGKKVVLLEANTIASGTTGRSTGKPVRIHGARASAISDGLGDLVAERYVVANRAAQDALITWVNETRIECGMAYEPHLLWSTNDEGDERLSLEHQTLVGLDEPCELRPVRSTDMLPSAARNVLAIERELIFDPADFTRGIARVLSVDHHAVFEGTRVVDISEHDQGAVLTTNAGHKVEASHVVVATHVPVFDVSKAFASFEYWRSSCLAFESDELCAVATPVDDGGLSMRPVMRRDGRKLIVVCGAGRPLSDKVDEADARINLEREARALMPSLGSVFAGWDAHDAFAADEIPLVGRVKRNGRVWIATAFGGWGLTGGVMAGITITSLITRNYCPWAGVVDPQRGSIWRDTQVVTTGARAGKAWLGDRIEARRHPTGVTDLKEGEGKVVHADGADLAVARDSGNVLRAVSAKCTHKGCLVRFNSADATWDCPCHGSRFAIDGTVIEGPAVKPLEDASDRLATYLYRKEQLTDGS